MHKLKLTFLAVTLAFSVGNVAQADTADPCSCCTDDQCRASCQAMEASRTGIRQNLLQRALPQSASDYFAQNSCLDAILNTDINMSFGLPDIGSLIQRAIDAVKNAACRAIMGQWQSALYKVNSQMGTTVNLPVVGNVGSTGVSVGPSSGTGVIGSVVGSSSSSTTAIANTTQDTSSGGIWDKIKSLF